MNYLVVGGSGLIGKAVHRYIVGNEQEDNRIVFTTRSKTSSKCNGLIHLDLEKPHNFSATAGLPKGTFYHLAFLCAGMIGFEACEGNRKSWRVNVDGLLNVAMKLIASGSFVVYPSSESVEWSNNAYARQRAQVEAVLLATNKAIIMRVGRVTEKNVGLCARALWLTGLTFNPGVYYDWESWET